LESDYPYENKDGLQCRFQSSKVVAGTRVKNMVNLPNSQYYLKRGIAETPVSVAINAEPLQLYYGGVFQDWWGCEGRVNHAVTGIGYGTENGVAYWLIQNQWGTNWGENGYLKLARTENGPGICGCTTQNTFPRF